MCISIIKRLAYLFSFFIILGCSAEGNGIEPPKINKDGSRELTVFGRILAPQNTGKVQLNKITPDGGRQPIAEAIVKSDGTYSVRAKITEPEFYALNFYNVQDQIVFLNDVNVEINADGTNPEGLLEVKGSPDTDVFLAFQELQEELRIRSGTARARFMEATNKDSAQQIYKLHVAEATAMIKSFGDLYEKSIVSILALQMIEPELELPYLSQKADNLSKMYPTSTVVSDFKKMIDAAKLLAVGTEAPEINLPDPEGKNISLNSLRGKVVLVDFWAAWCGPCRAENPNVVRIYDKYKNKDFEILSVSLDRDRESWLAAIKADKLTWLHASDLKYWESAVVKTYNIKGIPLTILIDKTGKILAKNLRGKELEDKLAEVLK
jgi:thiol-disulfide isomerase/thioredoxin